MKIVTSKVAYAHIDGVGMARICYPPDGFSWGGKFQGACWKITFIDNKNNAVPALNEKYSKIVGESYLTKDDAIHALSKLEAK